MKIKEIFMKLETGFNNLIHDKDLREILVNELLNSFYSYRGFKCLSKNFAKSAYLKILGNFDKIKIIDFDNG